VEQGGVGGGAEAGEALGVALAFQATGAVEADDGLGRRIEAGGQGVDRGRIEVGGRGSAGPGVARGLESSVPAEVAVQPACFDHGVSH